MRPSLYGIAIGGIRMVAMPAAGVATIVFLLSVETVFLSVVRHQDASGKAAPFERGAECLARQRGVGDRVHVAGDYHGVWRGRCAAGSTSRNSLNHTSNDWTAAMVRVMRSSRVQPSWSTLLFDPTPLEVSCADMQG